MACRVISLKAYRYHSPSFKYMLDRTLNILCGSSNNRLFSKTKLKGPLNLEKIGSKKFTSKAKLQESTVVELIAIINSIHTHLIHSIRIMKRVRFRKHTRPFSKQKEVGAITD